jgi:hypothetical protein
MDPARKAASRITKRALDPNRSRLFLEPRNAGCFANFIFPALREGFFAKSATFQCAHKIRQVR